MADASKPKYDFNSPPESSQAQAKIKFCGYLKKKRNKMGGWRKMWFVLQDKLLLSYGSKEEYDNKLVSFKDVLNLVPGTIVRPLGGFRFTIETTSQAMYTFHCDDRLAYRKWITMLLYSLAADKMPIKSLSLANQFSNISLDSYPLDVKIDTENDVISSVSVNKQNSTIAVGKTNHITVGVALLPIGQKTAKILERNGIEAIKKDFNSEADEHQRVFQNQRQHSEQHFRLHNVPMYDRSLSATELRSLKHLTSLQAPDKSHTVNLINRMFYSENQKRTISREYDKMSAFDRTQNENVQSNIERKSVPAQESKTLDMLKDKIQHINIKGSRNLTLNITSDTMEKHTQKKLVTNATTIEEVIMKKELQPLAQKTVEDRLEPVYASVDFKSKYANRKLRDSNFGIRQRCNSYDSIIQQTYDEFPVQKQMHWKFENSRSQKPSNSLYSESCTNNEIERDEIDGIYEDSEVLAKEDFVKLHASDFEENIYEPINITSTPHHNSIWNYFNRLKINSIFQMTRIKKNSTEYTTKYSKPIHQNGGAQIFDFKNKNSANRKSIKVRMRKFCFREYEPKPFFKHNQQHTICNNQIPITPIKKLKNRWKSVKLASKNQNVLNDSGIKAEKRFFGSLPHLRKARISLFSNQHFQRNNGDVKTVKTTNTTSAVKNDK